MKKQQKRQVLYLALPFGVLGAVLLLRWLIGKIPHFHLWPCLFHQYTGLQCPGCGGTRALLKLLKLDILGSLRYHILPVLVVLFAGLAYAEGITALFGTHRRLVPRSPRFWIPFGVAMAAYFVLRNLVSPVP